MLHDKAGKTDRTFERHSPKILTCAYANLFSPFVTYDGSSSLAPGVRSITSTTDLLQVEVWKSWLTMTGAQHHSAVAVGGLKTTQTSSTWRSTSSSHIATCEVGAEGIVQ